MNDVIAVAADPALEAMTNDALLDEFERAIVRYGYAAKFADMTEDSSDVADAQAAAKLRYNARAELLRRLPAEPLLETIWKLVLEYIDQLPEDDGDYSWFASFQDYAKWIFTESRWKDQPPFMAWLKTRLDQYDGAIDQVEIVDRVLTDAEIVERTEKDHGQE